MTDLTTPEAVRAHYGEPHPMVLMKVLPQLDKHCRRFIEHSPFLVLATSNAEGRLDATPRGDMPGFVAMPDARTLLIPDRIGNNRADAMMNIAENPYVGVLFMVPGLPETLKVNGRATVTIDPAALDQLAVAGKAPKAAIRVVIEEVFFQCGKALVRSALWTPEKHSPPQGTFAPFGKIISEQTKTDYDPGFEDYIAEEFRTGLY